MSGPFAEGGPIAATTSRHPYHRYPLDNDDPLAAAHHTCLSTVLDPFSQRRTRNLFAPDGGLRGLRCLDVGAGVGARYALWLADQVGPYGRVLAADLKPRGIPPHPQLDSVELDLSTAALPGTDWDFIHARLTLCHLPQRRDILRRLVGALKPGGRLLVEDWDTSRTDMVLAAPTPAAAELYTRYQETVGAKVFAASGTDRAWARRVHAAMRDDGLTDVRTVVFAESWPGGGPGAHLVALTIDEVWQRLVAAGLTRHQLDQVQKLLSNPALVLAGHPLYSTSGQRRHD